MCDTEYKMRAKKHNVYHMGLVTRQGAEKSLRGVAPLMFKKHYSVPPISPTESFKTNVKMYHNSIYLAGKFKIISSVSIRSFQMVSHLSNNVTGTSVAPNSLLANFIVISRGTHSPCT